MRTRWLQTLRLMVVAVAAVSLALSAPGMTVMTLWAADRGGGDRGVDKGADKGGKDSGGGRDAASGRDTAAGSGGHRETTSGDTNGDTRGDIASDKTGAGPHTGASGLGAGGDDKITSSTQTQHAAPAAGVGTTSGGAVTSHAASGPSPTPSSAAIGSRAETGPGVAGAGAGPELFGAVPAGAGPEGAAGEIAGAAPGGPEVLGATQEHPGAVLGAMQQRPRVLPFGGITPALAFVIGTGKWLGGAMMIVGVGLLLATGLRRRGVLGT